MPAAAPLISGPTPQHMPPKNRFEARGQRARTSTIGSATKAAVLTVILALLAAACASQSEAIYGIHPDGPPVLAMAASDEPRVRWPEEVPVSTTTTTPPLTPTTIAAVTSTTAAPTPAKPKPGPTPTTTAPPTATTTAAPATGGFSAKAERDFYSKINGLRSSQGLPGLTRSGSLDGYARDWAKRMATTGVLSHSSLNVPGLWSYVAENVGHGTSVSALFNSLSTSSGHRSNMLSANFTHVGIGVWIDADGNLWTAHVFAG